MSVVAKRSPMLSTLSRKSYCIELELETLLVYYFRVIDSVSESSRVVKEQNYLVLNRDKIPNKGIDSFYD